LKNIEKLDDLITRGNKYLIVKDADSAVDLLSEAARLADFVYGAFAPETFLAYLNYGRSLAEWAADQYSVVKMKVNDEAESSSDEEESAEKENDDEIEEEVNEIEENEGEDNEDTVREIEQPEQPEEITDETEDNGEEQNLDEVDHILKDAWNVLEVAKETSERKLKLVTEENDVRKWNLRLSDSLYYLGQVLLLSDQSENAKIELTKSLEIKQKFLDKGDRELASNYYQIGKSFEAAVDYSEAKKYYEKALEIMKIKLEQLEASASNDDDKKEVEDLKSICNDLETKIKDTIVSQNAMVQFEESVKGPLNESKPSTSTPVDLSDADDISNLVRKRRPASDSNDTEAKKPKE